MSLEEYKELLNTFDVTYEHSDDSRRATKHRHIDKKLRQLEEKLRKAGYLQKTYLEIWNSRVRSTVKSAHASKYLRKPTWIMKGGKSINIEDMEQSHIINAMKMCIRVAAFRAAKEDFLYLGYSAQGDQAQIALECEAESQFATSVMEYVTPRYWDLDQGLGSRTKRTYEKELKKAQIEAETIRASLIIKALSL